MSAEDVEHWQRNIETRLVAIESSLKEVRVKLGLEALPERPPKAPHDYSEHLRLPQSAFDDLVRNVPGGMVGRLK